MDSALPVAVPAPHKNRRDWLIAFGIIEILVGCAFLFMILGSAIAFLGPAAARMPPSAMSPRALLALVGLQYGLMAAAFFTGGIGSIRCKNWARILMLVVSGLWLALGLISTLIMAFIIPTIMHRQSAKIPPGMQHAIMLGMFTAMLVLGVLLPAIFLFFYTRQSVKATCPAQKAAQGPTPAAGGTLAPGLPVPLVILGVWQALSALSVLAILFMQLAIVFGVVLRGAAAALVLLAFSALSGYAAWATFHQKLIGWQIALFTAGFWTISMLVTYARYPDPVQLYREMGYSDQMVRAYEQFPQGVPLICAGSIVMATVYLVFLLYMRKFFPTDARA
jgi:MFS family permease